jgi:plasmid stabilization system protein ParE
VPVVDQLIKRATSGAHDAVDSMAAKVTSLADGLQGGVSKVGDTRDKWIESARDAIRQHPFAAVAGSIVIGAALLSLSSSRRD